MKTRLGKREAFCRKDCIHDVLVRRRGSIAFDVKIRKDLNRICSDIIIINLIKTVVKRNVLYPVLNIRFQPNMLILVGQNLSSTYQGIAN